MKSIRKILKSFGSERGATMLEYALLAALVAVGSIGAISSMSEQVDETFKIVDKGMGGTGFDPQKEAD